MGSCLCQAVFAENLLESFKFSQKVLYMREKEKERKETKGGPGGGAQSPPEPHRYGLIWSAGN